VVDVAAKNGLVVNHSDHAVEDHGGCGRGSLREGLN
jgi:hypothetical protein